VTQEKIRLKFRVSAFDGVSSGGMPEPRWTEKWGVGLFDYEEFHVTDQLLKLPFQDATPKTVCVFSIFEGALAFRHLDTDRRAQVNGVERTQAIITTGDKIKIGETLTIEVAHAPPKSKSRANAPGPTASIAKPIADLPRLDPEEGPTLTFSPTGSHESERPGMRTTAGGDIDFGPTIPPSPVFPEQEHSIEIQEPSLNALRGARPRKKETTAIPDRPAGPMKGMEPEGKVELMTGNGKRGVIPPRPASLSAGPMKGMEPEGKVELDDGKSPSGIPRRPASMSAGPMKGMEPEGKVELMEPGKVSRDRSLEDRMEAMAELTDDHIKPLYADEADLSSKPTFGERILSAIARILKRDDMDPPAERFPLDEKDPSKPWIPRPKADPDFFSSPHDEKKQRREEPQEPKPWIPEFISAASRIRGRALIFLVAAIGTLMIAVGVFRIQYKIATLKSPMVPTESRPAEFEMGRGIPIEIIEDKVRRMRPPRR
jgi:hypothetical protein